MFFTTPSFWSGLLKAGAGIVCIANGSTEIGIALVGSGIASMFGKDKKPRKEK